MLLSAETCPGEIKIETRKIKGNETELETGKIKGNETKIETYK